MVWTRSSMDDNRQPKQIMTCSPGGRRDEEDDPV